MEVELAEYASPEEETLEADDENPGSFLDGETCGICMEIIIDRGILDCCQDWFCFSCIDNWATITNLCPICQNEFQLITCVPVYDTIGSSNVEEDTLSTDEDWCIEGKSNTLSFPSYYIDENAVVCLDGDGCKIRSGSAALEEDSNLDTSIACDSCDLWYHAFCVGFDSEGTSENTWLCPRCVVDEMKQKLDISCGIANAGSGCILGNAFSGKVSVSVADTGETAVVVSMVGRDERINEPNSNFPSTLEAENNLKIGNLLTKAGANSQNLEMSLEEGTNLPPNLVVQNLELSLPQGTSSSLPLNSLEDCNLKSTHSDQRDSCTDPHLGLSVSSFPSVDHMHNDGAENQVTGKLEVPNSSDELPLSVNRTEPDATEDVANTGAKRKRTKYSDDIHCSAEAGEVKANIKPEFSAKKIRADGKIQTITSKGLANEFVLDASKKRPTTVLDDEKLRHKEENVASDIFSIVQGTNRRSIKGLAHPRSADKDTNKKENEVGLRVKKIMRRASNDKESSMVVQKLREEIREAVRNRSSAAFGKNLFDPKLLSAFRAAVARPTTDEAKKIMPSVVRVKKTMLQKGTIRENLTKKIYATYSGRRKRAWDRECEVEFWKHRCMKVTKTEKVETLQSVLNLLRSTENVETQQASKGDSTNPILSRLYLADSSIFPRKDDIKPVSTLDGDSEKNKEHPFKENVKNKGNDSDILTSRGATTSGKVHPSQRPKGSSVSAPGNSKGNLQKETVPKSNDVRADKRKWALEVLARKTATTAGKSATQEKQGVALLKGNYPLLKKLPVDMRPVLAPSRHNKIPISVRQAQLYRLTEHFLRKANLPVISRTAVTELAVVDAINIEKEVADRSSSKLVYINLCSQELLHRSENTEATETANTSLPSPISADKLEAEQTSNKILPDPLVEEALRAAGLFSDSPPNSPVHVTKKIEEEGPDNVFEIDSNPELDIYGDFEYDLEDEDYIGILDSAKLAQQKSEEGELKLKLVFSTLNSDGLNHPLDSKDEGVSISGMESKEHNSCPPPETLNSDGQNHPPGSKDEGVSISGMDGRKDNSCLPPETLNREGEVPSLAECEELYGPDKEPIFQKFPVGGSKDLCEMVEPEVSAKKIGPGMKSCEKNLEMASVGQNSSGGENSPIHSQAPKDAQKKKNPNSSIDKQFDGRSSVHGKVEAYVKEHIRPLCKSGVISAEQYRWAVSKTTEKVMKFHSKDKTASFLIKEGDKVKKLAEQYVEASQQKDQKMK